MLSKKKNQKVPLELQREWPNAPIKLTEEEENIILQIRKSGVEAFAVQVLNSSELDCSKTNTAKLLFHVERTYAGHIKVDTVKKLLDEVKLVLVDINESTAIGNITTVTYLLALINVIYKKLSNKR